jgi:uncharacterized protein (DUF427 family)
MRSPGHLNHPEHHVRERRMPQKLCAQLGADVFAESTDVIEVDADGYPARYYFPRAGVRMDTLERSETTTHCPFKGDATWFSMKLWDGIVDDVAWSYEQPYEEHGALAGRIAFDPDRIPELQFKDGG